MPQGLVVRVKASGEEVIRVGTLQVLATPPGMINSKAITIHRADTQGIPATAALVTLTSNQLEPKPAEVEALYALIGEKVGQQLRICISRAEPR